ncbi:MAG: 1-acyl-sn-glycerol-3-phosphate acyltransferase [Pseudodesulfovibrio sp.]
MNTLHTIWINFGIYTGTLLWTLVGIPLSPIGFVWFKTTRGYTIPETVRKLIWIYGRVWVRLVACFVPVTIELTDMPSPCVLVVNHASFFDTYFFGVQPQWNCCFAVRNWPFEIPFYRPFMEAAGYVRTEGATPEETIKDSVKAIKNGANIVYFPEGTRTETGDLKRFYSGAFYTAIAANVPVVPLCISGTFTLLPRGRKLLRYTPIKVRLLPPVYPDKYQQSATGHNSMRKRVKTLMGRALAEMDSTPDSH